MAPGKIARAQRQGGGLAPAPPFERIARRDGCERIGHFEVLRLDTQVQKEEETSRQLKASIDGLQHDPKALERLARERLGYAKPGEMVVRFEGTNSVATP